MHVVTTPFPEMVVALGTRALDAGMMIHPMESIAKVWASR
jgi:hypothetical protein